MEIGTEISRKIRTAIKGKLQELGAYVDEELPDYIMVMVANKKSQEQMTDDLSLFLGNNTLRFTTWLQGVLDKLRAVTPGSNSLKASEAIIFNSTMPPLKSQSKEDSGRDLQPQRQEKFHSIVPGSSQVQRGLDRSSTEAGVATRLTSAVKPLHEMSPSEDIIDIKLDTDDPFNDDLSYSSESSLHVKKKPPSLIRTQRPTAEVYRPPGSTHRLDERSSLHRPSQSVPVSVRQSSFRSNRSVGSKPYELQEACRVEETFRPAMGTERALQEFDGSRKRKIPVASSVVKVRRILEELEEEDEEEEENYLSRAAPLSSSVSVPSRPERRPTLSPSKQANKNLILKAISEAQESITKTTSYSAVPSKQMVPVAPRARPVPEEELILMKSRASMLRYQQAQVEAPAQDSRQVDEHRLEILSRLRPEPVEETATWGQARSPAEAFVVLPVDERRMDVLSRLHPEPVEESTPWGQGAEETENLRPMDSRSFILKNPKVSKTPPMQTPPTPDVPQQIGRLIQPRENIIPEKPASPKFIVTLDGVPSPRGYHSDEEMEVDPPAYTEEGLYAEPHNLPSIHLTQPNSQDVHASDEPAAVSAKSKIHERCKYWPACKNAEHCVYHHPTTVCKAFPKCRFAEKCFFIHPNCKFDAKCTKAECPYTHASRRIPPAPAKQEPTAKSHVKVQCRFFPSCKNTECPFFHPKHCRFSNHCKRADCEFYHPASSVPPRHALTWTRAQVSD